MRPLAAWLLLLGALSIANALPEACSDAVPPVEGVDQGASAPAEWGTCTAAVEPKASNW